MIGIQSVTTASNSASNSASQTPSPTAAPSGAAPVHTVFMGSGSDRDAVLKAHPAMETFCIYNHVCGVFSQPEDEVPIGVGLTEAAAMLDARSRLPDASALHHNP